MFSQSLFPYELFVKLYNWNKVELQPFGLTNCGNRLVRAVPYSRKVNSKCYSIVFRRYEIVCDVQGFSSPHTISHSPICKFNSYECIDVASILQSQD